MSKRKDYGGQIPGQTMRFRLGVSEEKSAKLEKDAERKVAERAKRRKEEIESGTPFFDKRCRSHPKTETTTTPATGTSKISKEEEDFLQMKAEYANTLKQVLGDQVHVYYISKSQHYAKAIQEIQDATGPLDEENEEFQKLDTKWIHTPGIHIGIDSDDLSIIFMVHIWEFKDMPNYRQKTIQPILKNIMDWTFAVPAIQNNGAHQERADSINKPTGKMFALGWHGSMERGKKVVWYASKTLKDAQKIYSSLTQEKAAEIAFLYRDGLATLHPAGFQKLYGFAQEKKILGFQQLDARDIDLFTFANSLIITRDDFSNYQHVDKDEVDLAYGLWWAGLWDDESKRYVLSDDCDHDKISGGSFLFSEYGYAIQFEKCRGLVEVTWRGSKDLHSTMRSQSAESVTRFGTSVQITRSALRSMNKWREEGSNPSQVTSHTDRVEAKSKISSKTSKK